MQHDMRTGADAGMTSASQTGTATRGVSRRAFVAGAAAAGAGMVAASRMASAAEAEKSSASSSADASAASDFASVKDGAAKVSQTYDCDIVIVGGGLSGLSAAVQAGELGANTILLEAGEDVGGNGTGVEGIFGCNTSAQREQGIELDPGAIVRHELEVGQHLPDGVLWTDLVNASADNYDWLVSNGVQFSGTINDYGGLYPTMHWFGGNMAGVGYVPPMKEKAESYGVQIMTSTSGKRLVFDGTKVTGVIAEDADGNAIQVNAKGVILATGGFGYNDALLEKWGYKLDHLEKLGNPHNNADGINMALAVGAQDCTDDACFLAAPNVDGLFGKGDASGKLCFGGSFLWVNRDGERFVNEDLTADNVMIGCMPMVATSQVYCLADADIIDSVVNGPRNVTSVGDADAADELADVLEKCPSNNIYQADTIAELAGKFGMDADTLQATVDSYNEMCDAGSDAAFGKKAENMVPIRTAPFTMYRLDPAIMVAIGGLGTNRSMQVIDDDGEPIPGLYAIGTDGVRLYRKVYPIQIGATCCGNNVNSGRVAARHIVENLL